MKKENKCPCESYVETRYMVMPSDANPSGTVFGGTIASWIDMTAAMAAARYAQNEVVTVLMEKISFDKPIYIGNYVCLRSVVTYTGTTSLEVEVSVLREDIRSGESVLATKAYLVFVAIDAARKPVPVPVLVPETELEKCLFEEGRLRALARKKDVRS